MQTQPIQAIGDSRQMVAGLKEKLAGGFGFDRSAKEIGISDRQIMIARIEKMALLEAPNAGMRNCDAVTTIISSSR